MKNKSVISEFINKVVAGEMDAAKGLFSEYCNDKAKSTLNMAVQLSEKQEMFESFKQALVEQGTDEMPIRMDGDKILVNGKLVGSVQIDMNDFESGINFVSTEGNFSKEFDTAEDLFSFLSAKFLGEK